MQQMMNRLACMAAQFVTTWRARNEKEKSKSRRNPKAGMPPPAFPTTFAIAARLLSSASACERRCQNSPILNQRTDVAQARSQGVLSRLGSRH
eukprot:4532004-Amphidinium_carterae.1